MHNFIPVTHLLSTAKASSCVVAYDNGRVITWGEFVDLVSRCAGYISNMPEQVWGVYFTDSFRFSVMMFALWHTNRKIVLLKDNLAATVAEVLPELDALVGNFDFQIDVSKKIYTWDQVSVCNQRKTELSEMSVEAVAFNVYTSGSTGKPQKIPLKFFQLVNETRSHEALWGGDLSSSPVVATVSHQHLYGLIFKVIWPLSAARPFINENVEYLEDLLALLKRHMRLTLITTPSHLARLPASINREEMRDAWAAVFSSAAPLSESQSREAEGKFGVHITEVYGSSETGGIAWRQQTSELGEIWQAFSGIEMKSCENTGVLKLRSPFLASNDFYVTSDKVELFSETRFKLLGRVDRIVKIEGKRVSLEALEQEILKSAYVQFVRVISIKTNRDITCAVMVLSAQGKSTLEVHGKPWLIAELKTCLRRVFEAVVIPRKWRVIDEFACDQQGKVSQKYLASLFETTE